MISSVEIDEVRVIPMGKMKPYDIGVIIDDGDNNGSIVMRTASVDKFEVMDLSNPSPYGSCWNGDSCTISVSLLSPGSKIILAVA